MKAILLRACLTLGCFGVVTLTACSKENSAAAPANSAPPAPAATANQYQPTATFQEIMDSIVDQSADVIWNSVSFTSDERGTHEVKPTSADDWLAIRRAAIRIAESANLIAVPGRKVANNVKTVDGDALEIEKIQQRMDADHAKLVGFGGAMRDIGLQLVAAADRRDIDALTELGGTLDSVCEACHRTFWYPGQPAIDQP